MDAADEFPEEFVRFNSATGKWELLVLNDGTNQYYLHQSYNEKSAALRILRSRDARARSMLLMN